MLQACILCYKPCGTRYKVAKQAGRRPPRDSKARILRLDWGVFNLHQWQMAALFNFKSSEVGTLKTTTFQCSSVQSTRALCEPSSDVNISFCTLRSIFIRLWERVDFVTYYVYLHICHIMHIALHISHIICHIIWHINAYCADWHITLYTSYFSTYSFA
jgi:hypothetical protein